MQNDHTTIFEIAEEADDVMTEMAAAGFGGMSEAQADIVVRMGKLLDKAAKIIGGISGSKGNGELVNRAANHALAMRMHGATLRGASGAALLEDLCDAVMGRYTQQECDKQKTANIPKLIPANSMTVEEAMDMLKMRNYSDLSRKIACSVSTTKVWRDQGFMPVRWSEKVRALHSAMQVRAAA